MRTITIDCAVGITHEARIVDDLSPATMHSPERTRKRGRDMSFGGETRRSLATRSSNRHSMTTTEIGLILKNQVEMDDPPQGFRRCQGSESSWELSCQFSPQIRIERTNHRALPPMDSLLKRGGPSSCFIEHWLQF